MALLLSIMVFLLTVVVVIIVGSVITRRRGQVKERLTGIRKMSVDSNPEDILKMPFTKRIVGPLFSTIGHTLGRVAPQEVRLRTDKKIVHAGTPWNLNFYTLLAFQILLAVGFFMFSIFLLQFTAAEGIRVVFVSIVLTMLGVYLPYFIISTKADARMHAIRRALPDMLDLLLISVEAGLGFDMALKKVTQQMPGPLSVEVRRALEEIRMGGDREAALRGIARRCGVTEVSSFISSVIQAEQLGSNIANTLRVQAEFMRQKRRQAAQELAMKAPVKLVFPLILFIFPALFVVIVGPAVIRIIEMFLLM